jgi:hypothetical protein
MNWTKERPTKPGFYAWRVGEGQREFACTAQIHGPPDNLVVYLDNDLKTPEEMGGEWCRLVPAEEIEKAFAEGGDAVYGYVECRHDLPPHDQLWKDSRARRVANGEEV